MIEREVEISAKDATLAGTLTLPDSGGDRYPVCLMIHGSGPLDRDENIPVQKLNVFNTIAERLAAIGVGSLRYDKRGCGKSTGDHYRASHQDTVEDAAVCVEFLKHSESIPNARIALLGHSEGTIIAPQLAPRYPGLFGLVLLSPFVQAMESILIAQAERIGQDARDLGGVKGVLTRAVMAITGGAVPAQQRLVKRLKTTDRKTFRFMLRKIPADSLRGLLQLDPPAIYRRVECPVLIIGGEKDLQCDPADVQTIAGLVQGAVEHHVIPDLTHILRRDAGAPSFFRYAKIMNDPLDEEVLAIIGDWFRARL